MMEVNSYVYVAFLLVSRYCEFLETQCWDAVDPNGLELATHVFLKYFKRCYASGGTVLHKA